jgi:hypothetical protein
VVVQLGKRGGSIGKRGCSIGKRGGSIWEGSAQHLYVVCIYGAICLQIQNNFPPDRAFFSPKNVILILSMLCPDL